MVKIIVNTLTNEKRFIVLNNDKVEQIIIEQPTQQSLVGNIYYGMVADVVPGMNAAFINIGEGRNGFLHINDLPNYEKSNNNKTKSISNLIHQGEKIIVQVTKDATLTKGPRLTGIIELESNSLIYMPYGKYVAVSRKLEKQLRNSWRTIGEQIKTKEEGLIFRTACETLSEEDALKQLQLLREKYTEIERTTAKCNEPTLLLERDTFFNRLIDEINEYNNVDIVVDDLKMNTKLNKIFEHHDNISISLLSHAEQITYNNQVDNAIAQTSKRIVWLKNGAYIIFDETEALTVIDVNTGKYIGKGSLRQTVLKVNEIALKEIAQQIRLRNIGGIILIDFINMEFQEDRDYILKLAKREFSQDKKRTTVLNFTSLGILQLTRKKTTPSILETLTVNCPVCDGSGSVLSSESVAFHLERTLWEYRYNDAEAVLIEATEGVIDTFNGENESHRKRLEELLHLQIFFLKTAKCKPDFTIRQFGTKSEILNRLNSLS